MRRSLAWVIALKVVIAASSASASHLRGVDVVSPEETTQEAALEKVAELAAIATEKKDKLDRAVDSHVLQVELASRNGAADAQSTQTHTVR